jgi:hypothetical protein
MIYFLPQHYCQFRPAVIFVLKRLRRIKATEVRGSKSSRRPRQGLMILKIFLGMEWMLILGGDVGLYTYLVFLVSFRLLGLE